MKGESNLKKLIMNMKPVAIPGEYVFCTIKENQLGDVKNPLLVFRESEGVTAIISKAVAERNGILYDSIWGLISLTIHSDLEAIGFLSVITTHLANAGISVNVVSAYFHDHLFVPYDRVNEAVTLLSELSDSER